MIYASVEKTDERDAEMLARIARFDPQLLSPIHHRGPRARSHLAVLKSRDRLVKARTAQINFVRGMVKSIGERLPSISAVYFHEKVRNEIPEELAPALTMVVEELTKEIKMMDCQIERLCEQECPEAERSRAIHGVGPITSLAFVLTLEEKTRFAKSRSVPAYLGLTPRRTKRCERARDAFTCRAIV
jgi:transposase